MRFPFLVTRPLDQLEGRYPLSNSMSEEGDINHTPSPSKVAQGLCCYISSSEGLGLNLNSLNSLC